MVRIPLIRRHAKPDSSHGEDDNGKGKDSKAKDVSRPVKDPPAPPPAVAADVKRTTSPEPAADKDRPVHSSVAEKGKKIPFPLTPPEEHGVKQGRSSAVVEKASTTLTLPDNRPEKQPADAPFVARVVLPESPPEPDKVTQAGEVSSAEETSPPASHLDGQEAKQLPEADVIEKTASPTPQPHENQPERAEAAGADSEGVDALAVLQAMPDYIFRIGRDGISPVLRNGGRAGTGAAPGGTGVGQTTDGKVAADEADKSKLPEKMLIEELARQSEPHARKVLETKLLQTFEFEVRGEKEAHHLEVRLAPFGQSEVLALVRDITDKVQRHNALIESRNELENHLKERNAELMRVNKMLKTEVELREEQEDVLKKNFHRIESLLDETIGAITLIVERKDPHVADHQRRVCLLACAIAQEMNSRNDRMRAIRMAAQLHDLGKIFIPAEIMRKPGKLTDAEVSVMKTHPDTDYQILKRINFPISIADIVRQHHERMNGSGYPQGLKGDDILVEARIIGVADVIEGMVFERPYRVAPGLEAALKEIADQKGILYDPAVADACLKLFAEGRFKFEPSPGQEVAKSGGEQNHESLVSVGQVPDRRDA